MNILKLLTTSLVPPMQNFRNSPWTITSSVIGYPAFIPWGQSPWAAEGVLGGGGGSVERRRRDTRGAGGAEGVGSGEGLTPPQLAKDFGTLWANKTTLVALKISHSIVGNFCAFT